MLLGVKRNRSRPLFLMLNDEQTSRSPSIDVVCLSRAGKRAEKWEEQAIEGMVPCWIIHRVA